MNQWEFKALQRLAKAVIVDNAGNVTFNKGNVNFNKNIRAKNISGQYIQIGPNRGATRKAWMDPDGTIRSDIAGGSGGVAINPDASINTNWIVFNKAKTRSGNGNGINFGNIADIVQHNGYIYFRGRGDNKANVFLHRYR